MLTITTSEKYLDLIIRVAGYVSSIIFYSKALSEVMNDGGNEILIY